jgi:hypothetical protein
MIPKLIRNGMVVLVAAVVLFTAACNKSQTRTDAQVASDIQGKLNTDQAVQNKQIAVLAANGVVTLSGSVNSEAERSAVASDAANVTGVRTVVNNLTVQPADASNAQPQPQSPNPGQPPVLPPSQPSASQPATTTRGISHKPSAAGQSSANQGNIQANNAPLTQADAMQQSNQAEPPPSTENAPPPAPVPPPPPAKVTIPDGTVLAARMLDTLDSETANPGDTFRATLNSPVQVDGRVVIPADADLYGRVVDVHAAGRFKGAGLLTIEITKVGFNGRSYPIHTNQWSKESEGRGKNTAEKVGGGAALGALIGAIAGGGKGAGIGAAVGAGAGGVTQGVTRAAKIKLGPESLLTFHLAQPVTVQPARINDRNAGRPPVN